LSTKTILIVGQSPDPHIDCISNLLKENGASVIFFDIYNPEKCALTLDISDKPNHYLDSHEMKTALSNIHAIWWRAKPSAFRTNSTGKWALWAEFAHREWKSILESLHLFTSHAKWINPRSTDLYMRNKPAQILIAQEIGFNIPPTLISNDPSRIMDFLVINNEDAVYKVLTYYIEPPNQAIFTSRTSSRQVQNNIDSIRIAPGIFQKRIEKSFELRITVVGEEIFSVRIDSQLHQDTKLDWRRNQADVPYSKHKLPNRMAQLIKKMNKFLGLVYGAYDFIVTNDNDYYFLEVNPQGQWLWIENKLNLPISRSLANHLLM